MNFKGIRHYFGWTNEMHIEYSDILSEEAVVFSKNYLEDKVNIQLSKDLGMPMCQGPKYYISFSGKTKYFCVDNQKLFETFNEGDKVIMEYRNSTISTWDFIPPNFEKKQIINQASSEPMFVRVKKLFE